MPELQDSSASTNAPLMNRFSKPEYPFAPFRYTLLRQRSIRASSQIVRIGMSSRLLTGSVITAFLITLMTPAVADNPVHTYTIDGEDSFQIAGQAARTDIVYAGTQR